MNLARNCCVAANDDENGREWVLLLLLGKLLPFEEALMPFGRQKVDGRARVVHDDFRCNGGAKAIFLRLGLHPPPDVEIGRFRRAGHVTGW